MSWRRNPSGIGSAVPRRRRALRTALAALAVVCAAMAMAAPPSMAQYVHPLASTLTGSETPQGAMFPFGVAAGPAGKVYVLDARARVIDRFAAGKYECQITGAPGSAGKPTECDSTTAGVPEEAFALGLTTEPAVNASGDLFVGEPHNHAVMEFNPQGGYVSEIPLPGEGNPAAISVDSSGNLFIIDTKSSHVLKYEPSTSTLTTFVAETTNGPFGGLSGIAVDDSTSPSHGDVYVVDSGNHVVDVFSSAGTYERQITGTSEGAFPTVGGAAVDPTNGDLYVTAGSVVDQFSADGTFIAQTPMPNSGSARAVSVDGATGDIYVADALHQVVDVFGPGIVVPNVSVSAPTEVEQTMVTLHGEVEPAGGGEVTSCTFEYGETPSYGQSASCDPPTPYTSNTTVSASLTALSKSTTYYYRLKASNASGSNVSGQGTFTTRGPASVGNEWVVAGPTNATFNTEIDPESYDTSCRLQYVSEAAFQASGYSEALSVPCNPTELGSGGTYVKTTAFASDLQAATTYHYRFVATNTAGSSEGADQTFITFGFAGISTSLLDEGEPYVRAGGHPGSFTTEIDFNTTSEPNGTVNGTGSLKDVEVDLPPGLIGNPAAVEECSQYDAERFQCASNSEVGTMIVEGPEGTENFVGPLFEVAPPEGVAAEFSARFSDFANAFIKAKVRTGEGYGVEADSLNITTFKQIDKVVVTMWGVPGADAHDNERYCRNPESSIGIGYESPPCGSGHLPEKPFLRTPTSCSGPLATTVRADTYQAPGDYVTQESPTSTGMEGCGRLHFSPSITVTPQASSADSPTGLQVTLHVPQEESAKSLAEADLKNATVDLPAGVTVNPSAATGLVGCALEGSSGINLHNAEPAHCPEASKIGSVELETPLFPHRIFKGGIFIAQQGNAGPAQGVNEFGSLLAIYLGIYEPKTGVVIKLAGRVDVNQTTGQLQTTFVENPQLPFENLRLKFRSGESAPLATPRTCGTYEATSMLEPWSHEGAAGEAGTPNAEPFSKFQVISGPGDSACGGSGFAPAFTAGTQSNQAGGFGAFTMHLSRNDGEQRLSSISVRMPDGLAAMLAKVPLCEEAQANAGTCSAASKIGHVTSTAGVGGRPVVLPQPGKPEDPVFLTGPYKGAPFGLSIVVPAEAGPFDLGTVVVRAKINVDPHTAQVSVESDPMPTMLQGIPLDVRSIDITVDRPDFMFNPTSCEPMKVAGSIGSAEGATSRVSTRFQAAGCRGLAFKPGFKVFSKKGHTRRFGAYLRVQVTSGSGQANIHSVFVELPKILPSRTETLKLACTERQFAENPSGCPAGSRVGSAIAHTPVLPVPLTGPAIFVSHGGAQFPDLDVVLQGDGVTVDLTGNTLIKRKVTSSNFKSVPDVPISKFQLTLPTGAHSALAAEGNLCTTKVTKRVKTRVNGKTVLRKRKVTKKRKLVMPTTITGQNGAQIKQSTVIHVEGCGAAKAGKKTQKHSKKKK